MERHDDRGPRDDSTAATSIPQRPSSPARAVRDRLRARDPTRPPRSCEPNFARGIGEDPPEGGQRGRFSEGEEELPDTPDKNVERRFSEGIEQSPTSD